MGRKDGRVRKEKRGKGEGGKLDYEVGPFKGEHQEQQQKSRQDERDRGTHMAISGWAVGMQDDQGVGAFWKRCRYLRRTCILFVSLYLFIFQGYRSRPKKKKRKEGRQGSSCGLVVLGHFLGILGGMGKKEGTHVLLPFYSVRDVKMRMLRHTGRVGTHSRNRMGNENERGGKKMER